MARWFSTTGHDVIAEKPKYAADINAICVGAVIIFYSPYVKRI